MSSLMFPAALLFAGVAAAAGGYSLILWVRDWYFSYEEQYVQKTEEDLYGMFSTMSPRKILQASLACFFTMFLGVMLFAGRFDSLLGFLMSLLAGIFLGLGASLLPRWILKQAAAKRIRTFDLQLLDALQSMSNALKAGFSILQAFESVVQEGKDPIAQEFDLFMQEIRLGVKFETAAENLGKRVPSEDLQIVLAGIEVARQTGGNLTEVFDRLAGVIRERMRVHGRIQSLTAMGRLQGWIVGLMPVILGVILYFMQPSMMINFITSPAGIMMLLLVGLFELVGFLLIRKIVNIDV